MEIKNLQKADRRFAFLHYLKNQFLAFFGVTAIDPASVEFSLGHGSLRQFRLSVDIRRFYATRWSSVADVAVDAENWDYLCAISQFAFRGTFLKRYERRCGLKTYRPNPKHDMPAWVAARLTIGRPATVKEVIETELKTIIDA